MENREISDIEKQRIAIMEKHEKDMSNLGYREKAKTKEAGTEQKIEGIERISNPLLPKKEKISSSGIGLLVKVWNSLSNRERVLFLQMIGTNKKTAYKRATEYSKIETM